LGREGIKVKPGFSGSRNVWIVDTIGCYGVVAPATDGRAVEKFRFFPTIHRHAPDAREIATLRIIKIFAVE